MDSTGRMIGRVLDGRYRLVEVLGRGGQAVTWLARDEKVAGRQCVVKVVRPDLASLHGQRIVREKDILARLPGIHTATLYDVGETPEGHPYLVSRFVEGTTLAIALANGVPMPERHTLAIALGVARALVEAHEAGVLHRDVKPSNIMLSWTSDGERVTLIDFGLAAFLDAFEGEAITGSGEVWATPEYASPEQCSGVRGSVDGRTDLYALGGVIYEMLTGTKPFGDILKPSEFDSRRAYLTRLVMMKDSDRPTSISVLRPDLSNGTADLAMGLLERDPNRRTPQTAAMLVAELERLMSLLSSVEPAPARDIAFSGPSAPARPGRPLPIRRGGLAVRVGMAAILAAGATVEPDLTKVLVQYSVDGGAWTATGNGAFFQATGQTLQMRVDLSTTNGNWPNLDRLSVNYEP